MKKIAVLDQSTIDKIAAGEVVERPASVVKELVENAIDAGATAVTVEIKEGGRSLIRITDNGSGMDSDQVPLAFLRHATSKIEKVEDLETIASLGFRGEALSSIAAVSQVELITKTHTAMSGTRYIIEGGMEKSLEEIGAPDGTTFLVRNLFYNVPAREKFLKTAATEGGYVSSLMEQIALSHPEISFKFIQNGQVKLHTSGNYQMKDVIYHIYGREITKELLEVRFENQFLKIRGYIGKPGISRGNRAFENYYVNGRYVKDRILNKAIEDAYKGFLMQHKFPFVSLMLEMEGRLLDVNVHPAKREVRFSREADVYQAVYQAVWNALAHKELIPEASIGRDTVREEKKESLKRSAVPEPFETQRLREERRYVSSREAAPLTKEEEACFLGTLEEVKEKEAASDSIPRKADKKENAGIREASLTNQEVASVCQTASSHTSAKEALQKAAPEREKPQNTGQMELFDDCLLSKAARSSHRLIGQLFDTYWLVQYEEKLYIIDQHAAHEKIYYERFVKAFQERQIVSQYLSPPVIVTLSLQEQELLKSNTQYFQKFGFEIEPFGGREYAISAVPAELLGHTSEELFLEMLDNLSAKGGNDGLDIFTGRLATMACKAAVKGNNRLSLQEANALIDELLTLENPYNCPHGRPTIISMTKAELEKKFKRII